jgi:hypothetical protein
MKAKDWAVSKGYCSPGRGRMPRAAHEAIQQAIAGGMTFSDYKGAPASKGQKIVISKDSPEGEAVKVSEYDQYAPAFMRYPLDQSFTYTEGEKNYTVNARQVCMPCGYSLCGHGCNDPVVLTKHGIKHVKPKGE